MNEAVDEMRSGSEPAREGLEARLEVSKILRLVKVVDVLSVLPKGTADGIGTDDPNGELEVENNCRREGLPVGSKVG